MSATIYCVPRGFKPANSAHALNPTLCPPLHCMHRLLIALAPSATTDGCAGGADGGAGVAVGTLKVFELQRGVSSP